MFMVAIKIFYSILTQFTTIFSKRKNFKKLRKNHSDSIEVFFDKASPNLVLLKKATYIRKAEVQGHLSIYETQFRFFFEKLSFVRGGPLKKYMGNSVNHASCCCSCIYETKLILYLSCSHFCSHFYR